VLVMIDLDNTLADRETAVRRWAQEFSHQRELPSDAAAWIAEIDQDGYADRRAVFEAIRSRHGLSDSIDQLLDAYRSRIVELTTPCEGARSCLTALRDDGHLLAIVTNGSSQQQHAKIDALELRSMVDTVVVSADRAIFELVANDLKAPLVGAWMVGDSPTHDIEGPACIGMRTAWLHRGRPWGQRTTTPTVELDSLADLPHAIASARHRDS
jgi:FMN phosphatase YigB (HAD superfamily)